MKLTKPQNGLEKRLIEADRVVKFMHQYPMWTDEETIKARTGVEHLFTTLHFARHCLGKAFGYQIKRVGGVLYFRPWTGHATPPVEEPTLWAESLHQTTS